MNPNKIKKLKHSFFKEGSLVYKNSGHKLIKSGEYYRCGKNSNQQCKFKERQVRSESLERTFSRKAKNLYTDKFPAEKTVQNLLRDHFWDVVFGIDKRIFGKEEIIDSTLSVMQEEVNEGRGEDKKLTIDFIETLDDERRANHPMLLFSFAISIVRIVSAPMTEAERGRAFALLSKRVYLTEEGKMDSVELERWAWYLLNTVIEKKQPGYLSSLKSLNIINGSDSLHSKGLYEAAMSYGEDGFDDALGEDFAISYGWIKMMREAFKIAMVSDPKKMQEEMPKFFKAIRNDVPLNAMINSLSIIK